MKRLLEQKLLKIYELLFAAFGPRHWWPAETDFEVVVGAILTQNVAWRNVEKAIANLKGKNLLAPQPLYLAAEGEIAELIRPTRYFNQKARKLKNFVRLLMERYQGNLKLLFALDLPELRAELLALAGIGPETADSIILYAARKPIFVVDAYTRRIFHRLGYFPPDINYKDMQRFFMANLPADTPLFNEYHALIDGLGHNLCLAQKPACPRCPLLDHCPFGQGQVKD